MSELEIVLAVGLLAVTAAVVVLACRVGVVRAIDPGPGLRATAERTGPLGGWDASGIESALDQVADALMAQRLEFRERHAALDERLAAAAEVQAAVEGHARSIGAALANPVARGAWGERMLDDLLAHAGMIEGINFVRQPTLESGRRPDVAVLLPGSRHVHIDAKFPAANYLRYCDAQTDSDRAVAARSFLVDMRRRVGELAPRGYGDAGDVLSFVVLFLPNEAVFRFVHEQDAELVDRAVAQGVVVCSPYSLFSVLAVIREMVELDSMNRRAAQVMRNVNALRSEWGRFSSSLTKVGNQLDLARRTFDSVAGTRARQLDRAFDALGDSSAPQALGAERIEA